MLAQSGKQIIISLFILFFARDNHLIYHRSVILLFSLDTLKYNFVLIYNEILLCKSAEVI